MIIPLKKFGQNFLHNKEILSKIVEAAGIGLEDTVLEIGPGLGSLTRALLSKTKNVIAIEKDVRLIDKLSKLDIKLINQDVLDYEIELNDYKVVANLPYYITLPIIRKFIESNNYPSTMTLLIQKEVAQKICADKSSLPKIAIEFFAKSKILFYVSKDEFKPKPKVDGAVIHIYDIQQNVPSVDQEVFFKILKSGFQFKRKTIVNNLSKDFDKELVKDILNRADISLSSRPEDLSLQHWINIVEQFNFVV
jgi:16S rRNA (adenine1518-N6/adenine1519-N6)-dimethyltransferase